MKRIHALLLLPLLLLMFSTIATAQSSVQNTIREYSLGDGYHARDVEEGSRKFTLVKFPDRMVGSETPCSYVLFAEGMHVSLLRIYGENAFLNKQPHIGTTMSADGISFYADTADNHRIEIVIMVLTMESRHPVGVRLEKLPIELKKF